MNEPVKRKQQIKSVGVPLTCTANEKLKAAAKKHGRSKQLEAMLRLYHSLNTVPEVTGDYYEITTVK